MTFSQLPRELGWIEKLPQRYRVVRLGSVVEQVKQRNTGNRNTDLLSLSYGSIISKDIETVDGLLPESFETYNIVEPGDVVFRLTDLQNDKRSLRTGLVKQSGIITSAYVSVRPAAIDSRYLAYFMRAMDLAKVFYSLGGGLRQSLNYAEAKLLPVLLPPEAEQRAIADYLDRETAEIDALISEQNTLLTLLSEHRASFLDSSLLALGSYKIPLKYRGSLSAGLTLGAAYNEPVSVHPYIRVANVQAGRLDLSTIAEVAVPDRVAEARRLYPGDVLMTEGGDRDKLGRGALWSGEVEGALHQNHVFAFRCGPQLDPKFLVYVLEASEARQYFEATASQSTNLASTNSTLVKRFRIPDVSLQLQKAVVESLDNEIKMIEAASEDAHRLIGLAEERRSALISAAVTGQIDVTAQDVPAAEQLQDELETKV